MVIAQRVVLFLTTNLLVMVLLGGLLALFGLEPTTWAGLLLFSGLLGFGGSFISLALSKWIAKRTTGARVIDAPSNAVERWLVDTVAHQARAVKIGTPEVAIFPSPAPNAFATGMNRNRALVAVSEGLLHHMDQREVEAVLAHEIAHVANGDMVTMTLLQGVMNTFVIALSRVLGTVVDKVVFRTERGFGLGYWVSVIVLEIVFGLLASIVVMAFSRWREYRADRGAADLVGADAMIAALDRLRRAQDAPDDMPQALAAFGIRNKAAWMALFSPHPPLDKRIAALRRA